MVTVVGDRLALCLSVPCSRKGSNEGSFSSCPFLSSLGQRPESGPPPTLSLDGHPDGSLGTRVPGVCGVRLDPRTVVCGTRLARKPSGWFVIAYAGFSLSTVKYEPQAKETIRHALCPGEKDLTLQGGSRSRRGGDCDETVPL